MILAQWSFICGIYYRANSVPCYNACMLGISGKYKRLGEVNLNYERSYENQVMSFGFYLIGVKVLEEWQYVKRV